ncbi:MAG: A/G-specific adenine glycosylase [Anaerocolumna sp.]
MTYNYKNTIDYLLEWYDNNARILPWRDNPKPYYVWISEIMLQQTRVEAVKFYFERFINALPDIKSLAYAEEESLLKLWEGLGYYNRIRNLQKAAIKIMEEYKGVMPSDYDSLLELPGIGSYTAGAIASIAFHVPEPAVDGNVLRVMKRVAGSFDDITKASVKKELEQDIRKIIPKERPGDFNQAVMELGAMVCIPNGKPLCMKCPIMHLCNAFHDKTEMKIPVKPSKKPRKIEEKTVLLIEKDEEYLIRKRKSSGLLAGLWELPTLEGKLSPLEVEVIFHNQGIENFKIQKLGDVKHIFTHIEWHMTGYQVKLKEDSKVSENTVYSADGAAQPLWAGKKQIEENYTLPAAFEKYRKCM